jgi:hypothetical protein
MIQLTKPSALYQLLKSPSRRVFRGNVSIVNGMEDGEDA